MFEIDISTKSQFSIRTFYVDMPYSKSDERSFYLTNAADTPPIVHAILEHSTRSWQYVVVDPSTRRGVVIDPVCSQDDKSSESPPNQQEDIIRLIEDRGYLIDHIFETHMSLRPKLTAAWSIRMHLSHTQGYPPQLASNGPVAAMHRMFSRKYGASNGFSTTLSDQHTDKESIIVGRMRVTVMHVPGFSTPNRRAYLIDKALFGAYSIAMPSSEGVGGQSDGSDPVLSSAKDDDQRRVLWRSMQRVLSLPEDTRVYHEEDVEGTGLTNCTTIERCHTLNPYITLNENEFIIRRRGELREQQDVAMAVSSHSKGHIRQGKGLK